MLDFLIHQMIAWLTPINLVLFLILLASAVIVWRAQAGTTFDFGNMLRDEEGKESALRLAAFGSFGISTWVLMQLAVTAALTETYFAIYLLTWSGSAVLSKFLEIWKGKP
jgi:hypothetical protein